MSIRPRSLVSNSLGSVIASGMLIFSTVLIPAVLARTLTRSEFDTYSIVLATLPLILILPQSMRAVGAPQLALAMGKYGVGGAMAGYWRFVAVVAAVHMGLSAAGIEAYAMLTTAWTDSTLRLGAYCILVYSLGLIATGLAIAPSAAQRDFLPDNIAKVWPGLFQLSGITAVWLASPARPLLWIFGVYVASSWSIAVVLLARRHHHPAAPNRRIAASPAGLTSELLHGLRGVLWWNVTAYLATAAAVMIVAVGFPSSIVPFSIATSLLGIVSAALGAVSGPIAVHATAALHLAPPQRRRFFLLVNTMFQAYIGVTALIIVAAPLELYVLWLTPQIAAEVKSFSLLLLPAAVIRLMTMNFTIFVMSAGRQQTLWLSPMVEAIISVVGSVVLGHFLGVKGIPLALTLSACVRLLMTLEHDERINRSVLALEPGDVLLSGWRLARLPRC